MPSRRPDLPAFTRRRLLGGASALALARLAALLPGCRSDPPGVVPLPADAGADVPVDAGLRFDRDPFTLGVASGEPAPDGMVLWTRLAPEPLSGGGVPSASVPVAWEVFDDEAARTVVQRGVALAEPDDAHSVHVEVAGLAPGRPYWYRFHAGGATSPVGRTRTAPAEGASLDRLRFAFASCQHYESGYYAAYRALAADAPDLVLHLGDYIYEGGPTAGAVRAHNSNAVRTLAAYRDRYALYKLDPDLQAAHAAAPWVTTWDDHEVVNDYAADQPPDLSSRTAFLVRRTAAYKAYWEHLPLRAAMRPDADGLRLYRRLAFGDLAAFSVLDTRQHRDHQACPAGRGGGQLIRPDCPERLDPARTMLGAAQERWLLDGLAGTTARWNFLAQQLLMAQLLQQGPEGPAYWSDGWDGYPASRARILEHLAARRTPNPVSLGGDIHTSWVTDLKADFDAPGAPVVATELVGTSISSAGSEAFRRYADATPHVRFFDGRHRGYVRCELTPRALRADLRAVDDVRAPDAAVRDLASFVVEDGRPGAQRA